MSFADLDKAAHDFAVTGPASETIEIKRFGSLPEAAAEWVSVSALVNRDTEEIGRASDRGEEPVSVVVSKTDIDTVDEGIDKVRLAGTKVYVIVKAEETPGGWEFHCAP